MCLDREVLKTAEKDIVCWKVVRLTPERTLVSLYQETPIKGGLHNSQFTPEGEEGWYAYADKKGVRTEIRYQTTMSWEPVQLSDLVVLKCKIPKGTVYAEGIFCGDKAYRADKMVIGIR